MRPASSPAGDRPGVRLAAALALLASLVLASACRAPAGRSAATRGGGDAASPAGDDAAAASTHRSDAPPPAPGDEPRRRDVPPDVHVVTFWDPDDPETDAAVSALDYDALLAEVLGAAGGRLRQRFERVLPGYSARLSAAEAAATAAHWAVEDVSRAAPLESAGACGDSCDAAGRWGLSRINQPAAPPDKDCSQDFTGAGVHLYVVDSGIRATHDEFEDTDGSRVGESMSALPGTSPTTDCRNHGTAVASLAAGCTVGLAHECTLHSVRVLPCEGPGTTEDLLTGLEWVASHAVEHGEPSVASIAITAPGTKAVDRAARRLVTKYDVVVVAAAGNGFGQDAGAFSPAREALAVTVSSATIADIVAGHANQGARVDVFAPGRDVLAAGSVDDTDLHLTLGTSMACGFVAGVAVLAREADATASARDVHDAVAEHAAAGVLPNVNTGLGTPNRYAQCGAGWP